MLYNVLKKLNFDGTLEIIDSKNKLYTFGNSNPLVTIRLTNKSIERKLFLNPGLHLGEAYMNEELIIEKGTIEEFISLISNSYDDFVSNNKIYKFYEYLSSVFMPFQQINQLVNSKKNVAHHYDIDENLYKLFLDKDMQYSCAYFHNPNIGLDQAQKDKKEHIIKKLSINENMNVLDIGCGWGSLSRHFNSEYGCNVKGISLSEEQISYCLKKQKSSKNSKDLEYSLQDYRNETNHYDKIVSVGMFEHVGKPFYNTYFKKINNLLSDDGIAVIHTIGNVRTPKLTPAFIRKYIFPGGYIPSLSEIMPAVEKSGLIISDIEVLRLHYADTLRNWYKNFQKSEKQVLDLYDERFIRMWESYLNLSEISFRKGDNVVYQLVLTKKRDTFPIVRKRIN